MDEPGQGSVALHVEVITGDGPTLVLLHGFTQTGASWHRVTPHLRHRALLVDLPGHGGSGEVTADLATTADLVARAIARHGGPDGAPVVVGYSMGGRVALRLALDHPQALSGLVLLGATAGIDDDDERQARRAADHALAASLETDGVEAFLERWLAQPLFAGLEPTAEDLAARQTNRAAGLAASLRQAGTGTMDPPWWDELAGIDVPTLVCWGERDARFAALGHRLAGCLGDRATTEAIAGAGHAAHLEAPEAFATVIEAFADTLRG